jgi:competence CoiA-like predicted nuclease
MKLEADQMILHCKVKSDSAWIDVDVIAAKQLQEEKMFCPACGGPLHIYEGGGAQTHFGHNDAHSGCPLTPYNFKPPASQHPDAPEELAQLLGY